MTDRRLEQRWARRDVDLLTAWILLMLAGAFFRPLFLVALALMALVLVVFVLRHLRRRRQWRDNPPGEFWIERVKD